MQKVLDAGADQFGGEKCTEILLGLVADGLVSEERLDVSARRLLREKFVLGLFENPFVDAEAADLIVGSAAFRAAGDAAQRASITVLQSSPALPFARGVRLYVEGIAAGVAAGYGEVVATPEEADLAVLRIEAPYEERGSMFENFFHAGSLAFPAETIAHVREVAAAVPTVVDVFLDRPAILTPFAEAGVALTANWGASPAALLDVLSGAVRAEGALPFDVPRSMAAVEASRPDVPFDTADPLFRFGHRVEI